MGTPHLIIRPGHPDFLDLPWDRSITTWEGDPIVDLPTGIHRHEIVFAAYHDQIYAIKELPLALARHEFAMLRGLEQRQTPSARAAGVVERSWVDPTSEWSAAVITEYVPYAFTYQELISGSGFGDRRNQMLDAFAGLLVELHLAGCFWGDCSLSNVLYRYDAAAIDAIMIDGETVRLHPEMTAGQRREDIDIMILNVAGGMADVAVSQGLDLDDADLSLGEDIADRYFALWDELTAEVVIAPDERYRIRERVQRLNELGFETEDFELLPDPGGGRLRLRVTVGGRNFHATRLRELTGLDASENQARQLLSDLRYHAAGHDGTTPSGKAIAAVQWRVGVLEPYLGRIAAEVGTDIEPLQRYCDLLHHRYALSVQAGHDVGSEAAFADWLAAGRPGYPLG